MSDSSSLLVGLGIGLAVGALLTVCLSFPGVARRLGKFSACFLIGSGSGLLVWGILSAANREQFESLQLAAITFYSPAQIIGWGAGLLGGGITALVLSFVASGK